jgi:large conductance mechanosensitive channel
MFKDFREFAMKGNVIDMAVGVIVGSAFGKIVTSLVNDVITPPIGLLLGKLDFSNMFFTFSGPSARTLEEARKAGAVTLNIGLFLNTVIDFLILVSILFLFIRQINRIRREPEPPPSTRECPHCVSSISIRATRCPHCTTELATA